VLVSALVLLALVQFALQLVFFLHLNMTMQQRWRVYMLGAMVIVVLVIVIGSLWIMGNLNARMTPEQEQQYMSAQGGL
jgi:cytochrome o ubiquinol oxidase operon protein cyoD